MGGLGQVNTLMPINKNTFCVAPWFSLYVGPDKKIAPCCLFENPSHDYNDIEEYFKSNELDKVRQDLLKGVKNTHCQNCWKDEEKGKRSLRLISNSTIGKFTDTPLLDQIKDPKLSNINSFDLVLGNLCNLKCIMCWPEFSSQLLAEAELNPSLKSRYKKEYNQKDYDWPKKNDFVEWCDKYLPQAIHIKFSGGEPFIIPWIHSAIDSIPDAQKKKCILHFTTNLTTINDKLFKCFEKFKEVWISVSVEGFGQTHEYLRFGHSWHTLCDNISKIKKIKHDNIILTINHVVQAPSYHSIMEMTKFFDEQQLEIRPIMITSPEYFHVSALTKKSKQAFLEDTKKYSGMNAKFIEFIRSVSQEHIEQDVNKTKELTKHLSEFDLVRGNDYKKVIPAGNISI